MVPGRAQQAENQETKEALDIPAELTRREDRKAALQQARQVIEARAKEMAAAQPADYQAKQAQRRAQREAGKKPRGPEATPKEVMAHRLKTTLGKLLYKLRKQTVEPVFGIIKEVMGFRRFRLRGHANVALEWTLVCVSYNLKRLFTLKNLAVAA